MATITALTQMFNNFLPAVTFSVYIAYSGQTLSLSVAVLALVLFDFISKPLLELPTFLGDLVSLIVSLKRIDNFLDLHEVQSGITERVNDSSEIALSLKGNFSWGFNTAKNDESEESEGIDSDLKSTSDKNYNELLPEDEKSLL